jgi:hypothetical protein
MLERFERHHEPLLSQGAFLRRLLRFSAVSLSVLLVSLLIGMVGYRLLEGFGWIDAFLNAAMLLGGMGPVTELHTTAGKLFAGSYALFSGIVFLGAVGLFLAPILHRIQHHFHLELESADQQDETK